MGGLTGATYSQMATHNCWEAIWLVCASIFGTCAVLVLGQFLEAWLLREEGEGPRGSTPHVQFSERRSEEGRGTPD
jgi:hypothetical protein